MLVETKSGRGRAGEPRRELGDADVESAGLGRPRRSRERSQPTSDYDALTETEAILIALQTPLSAQREPDLSIVLGAVEDIAPRLQKGQLVVLESTTYPGTTRERLLPVLERGGMRVGEDFHLAFSPERVDPGREDWTTQNTPKIVGGITPGLHRTGGRALQPRARDGPRGLLAGGGRAHEAAREHLSLRQHRARQRARAALRPDEHRRLGGHWRSGHEALRIHELPARSGARRPLHADRSLLSDVEGARVRLLHRVHRARGQGEREHAVLVPGQDRPRAERAREGAQGLQGAAPRRRVQGRHRRHARVAGAQADRAAPGRGRRGLLPRPVRPRAGRARPFVVAAGHRRGRLRRHRHGAFRDRLRRRRRELHARRRPPKRETGRTEPRT